MRRRGFPRALRVNEVIQTALAVMIQRGEAGELPFVSVTGVRVAPDFSFARVFVSLLDEQKAPEAIAALNEQAKHLRHLLAGEVRLRVTPELKFVHDDSIARGSRISLLINDAIKNRSE